MAQLPAHMRLTLESRHVHVECALCGQIVRVWLRETAAPEAVLDAARSHACTV